MTCLVVSEVANQVTNQTTVQATSQMTGDTQISQPAGAGG
jgi:hypothetical protein